MRNQFPTKRFGGILAGITAAAASLSMPAGATLLVQEEFIYNNAVAPVNEFNTRNGGTGFSGAWTANTLQSGLLSSSLAGNTSLFSPLLATPSGANNNRIEIGRSGGTANSANTAFRTLATPLTGSVGSGGSSLFVSFLLRQTSGTLNAGDQAYVWLGGGTAGGLTTTFAHMGLVGSDSTPMGIIASTGGTSPTTGENSGNSFAINQTYLFLARLTKQGNTTTTGGWDKIEYWIDPTLGSDCLLPAAPFSQEVAGGITSLTHLGLAGRNLESNDLFNFDDIRIFNDIANLGLTCTPPVPEASTVSLGVAMVGMAGFWYVKRNRKQAA